MNYLFVTFDPRPVGAEANEAIFASADGAVYGVEVTVAALAARCVVNLDHHGPGDTAETPSATEQALHADVPPQGATLATVRADADSVSAMALLTNRLEGRPVDEDLVLAIGRFDRLGPSAGEVPALVSAIAQVATDFKRPLSERVAWVQSAFAGEADSAEVEQLVAMRDGELAAARAASEVTLVAEGRVVTVVSTHRFATTLGYESAPVVVAMNPAMAVDFADVSKGTYVKYTACRYDSHVPADLEAALAELQTLEHGWGGRGDIFGSPQGVSSKLSLEEVTTIVVKHLK
jgi:hypothetical protein